jgi:hypothetical protein
MLGRRCRIPESNGDEPVNASAAASILCDPHARTLGLDAGPFSAASGQLIVRTDDSTHRLVRAETCQKEEDGSIRMDWRGLSGRLQWDADQALTVELTNAGPDAVRITEVCLRFGPDDFSTPQHAREYRQVIHGVGAMMNAGVKPLSLPASWSKTIDPPSNLYTIYYHDETGEALLLGALPPFGSAFTSVQTLHAAPHGQDRYGIEIRYDFQQTLAAGASLKTSPLLVRQCKTGMDGRPLLDDYARLMRARVSHLQKPRATGWNSWDYYAGAVQRKDMDANAQAARKAFGDRLDYIVIDEGYECMWGVWRANWKFPEGLGDYCRHIKSLGFRPGIWTAPLMVNMYTPLYRENPDWFISNADGSPFLMQLSYGNMAQLDITHPGAREHLKGVYRRLVEDGFEYFKCDFAQMALNAAVFHDPAVGRADLLRNLFQLVRDCIGPDRYLLSCLAPFESVIGIADAHRTTEDIHNRWSHIRQNVRIMFQRLWMQGTVGNTDPDFMIVRSEQTTDDRHLNRRMAALPEASENAWFRGPDMSLEQAKVLGLAVHLTGGDLVFGDALHKLNENGLAVLRRLADAKPPAPGRLINLLAPGQEWTPIVSAPAENGTLLGLFNLSDVAVQQHVDLTHIRSLTDFWTGQSVELPSGPITLPARSARGLYCTEE